jgi:2-polyprenyl-3-methyl-5-hydroxy-6-metoxy-1,4-benzoquinol methylase
MPSVETMLTFSPSFSAPERNPDMTTANPNVDFQEIAKFEQLASRWWDPDSEFKPLHDINPLRLDYIDERSRRTGRQAGA